MSDDDKPEFIDNSAPEFVATNLHAVERMGALARLIFGMKKRAAGGTVFIEGACSLIVPASLLDEIAAKCASGGVDLDVIEGQPDRRSAH